MLPRSNQALRRALYSLAHPLTILAMLLLLFNDHWLRWHYPSWLSGKLGDFAWLVFAPLIAAVLFALIVPQRIKLREKWVGLSAFVFIGLWFALAKTVPLVHDLNAMAVSAINGYPDSLRMDATDLLTLPALLVGWWVWKHADDTPRLLRPMAYSLLAVGILLTLANTPGASDSGIRCLLQRDRQIFAIGANTWPGADKNYVSDNGGVMWKSAGQPSTLSFENQDCSYLRQNPDFSIRDPLNQAIQYHFVPGVSIERSSDAGQTWKVEMDLSALDGELHRFYQEQKQDDRLAGTIYAAPGPFDAIFDPATHNLVVAMGQDGVLVRTTDGQWKWAALGPYHTVTIGHPGLVNDLLSYQFALAVVLGILALAWLLPTANFGGKAQFFMALSWGCWLLGVLVPASRWPAPSLEELGYFTQCTTVFAGIGGFIFILEIIAEMVVGRLTPKKLGFRVLLALLSVVLFLLPYVLWSQGVILYHQSASCIAIIFVSIVLLGGTQYLDLYRKLKNKKVDKGEGELLPQAE